MPLTQITGVRGTASSTGAGGYPSTLFSLASGGRVLIGFDDNFLAPSPTWTVIDATPNLVARIEIHRGRQTLQDQTNTGTATVYLNDTTGLYDPNNFLSPYYQKLVGKPVMLQCFNPVTKTWVPQFRGTIDRYGYVLDPSQVVANIQVDCVDVFDYLGGYQLQPGLNGKTPPAGSEGTICYYGATSATAQTVQDRITEILADVGIHSTMKVVFTGNVQVQVTKYDPGESALTALRDAADAELPTIANIYVDKIGRFVFHGRGSRFDPATVSAGAGAGVWDWQYWYVGDAHAISFGAGTAPIRVLEHEVSRTNMVNSAICYPRGIAETAMAGQVYEDATAITTYGKYSWTAPDLITFFGSTTGNTGAQETAKYAEFKVKNTKDPAIAIKTLTLKSLPPDDARAADLWPVLCGVDISDTVNLWVQYPDSIFGFLGNTPDDDYYVEGVSMTIEPGGDRRYDIVEVSLDVSPVEWSMDTHHVLS